MKEIKEATNYILKHSEHFQAEVAMILGSGLGAIADEVEHPFYIPYEDIPHFPISKVAGHAGRLVIGKIKGKGVLIMQGRCHYYEGHTMQQLGFPIRVMAQLGIRKMIVTNASGGVNRSFKTGDLMLIKDHVNFTWTNPLIGKNLDSFGPRFPDTSNTYTLRYLELAKKIATKNNIKVHQGTYFFMTGPSYETAAEVRMVETLGGDVVGMSTAPEALIACHCGMEILGLTYVANMGTGISKITLSHDDVMETMNLIKKDVVTLVSEICKEM